MFYLNNLKCNNSAVKKKEIKSNTVFKILLFFQQNRHIVFVKDTDILFNNLIQIISALNIELLCTF